MDVYFSSFQRMNAFPGSVLFRLIVFPAGRVSLFLSCALLVLCTTKCSYVNALQGILRNCW